MDNKHAKALLAKPEADILETAAGLERSAVVTLLALEEKASSPRETLIKALAERVQAIDADDDAPVAQAEAPAEAAPAWQAHDYNGPLTCEQAQWRHKYLPARWDQPATKPAAPVETK